MSPTNAIIYAPGTTIRDWTIIQRCGADSKGTAKWLARHACGLERVLRGTDLRAGRSGRCACAKTTARAERDRRKLSTRQHHPLFDIWWGMIARCHSPSRKDYARYGGRGIVVCDAWRGKGGFRQFVSDMGDRPSPAHSIDRINSAGPYSPENCRWATMKEQQRNRSNNRRYDFNGESLTLSEVSERCGVQADALRWRIRSGWSLHEAIAVPCVPGKWQWRSGTMSHSRKSTAPA